MLKYIRYTEKYQYTILLCTKTIPTTQFLFKANHNYKKLDTKLSKMYY